MMEEGHWIPNMQMPLSSDESSRLVLSNDSCKLDDHTEIFGLLPSSQARLGQQQIPDIQITYVENERLLMDIKALPVCMQKKRDIRRQERHKIGYWESRRRSHLITGRCLKKHVSSALTILLPWRHTLRVIKGQFGVGIKAYFGFLRYLLGLNLLYCIIISGSVLTPTLMYRDTSDETGNGGPSFDLEDVFTGSGFLEMTPVFHSFYTSGSLNFDCLNIPILFLLCMASIFFLSIIVTVRRTVVGYKQVWLTRNRSSNASLKVFCGWDFCIQKEAAAKLKCTFIKNDLKMDLTEQNSRDEAEGRSFLAWVLLIFLRIVINILVLVLLASSFILIYYSIHLSQNQDSNLILEYLPPITMMSMNYLLLPIFKKISKFEYYLPATQLNVTLIRSIFLKLASLGIYLFVLITAPKRQEVQDQCEENAFGKEMYKLILFNLIEVFVSTFCFTFPRTLLVERCSSSKLLKKLNKPEFDITSNVLDLVNSQTVTWVGVFYCPLLPALSAVRLLLLFYLKKFTLTRCCRQENNQNKRMFRTTSLSVLFHFTLCLGLILSVVTLGVNIYSDYQRENSSGVHVIRLLSVTVVDVTHLFMSTISYVSSEAFAYALILAEVYDKQFLVRKYTEIKRRQQTTR